MARRTRNYIPDIPYYVALFGNNGEKCLFDAACLDFYVEHLITAATAYGVHVHSYVLVPSRVLFLATPLRESSLPGMMKSLNASYASFLSTFYGRTGTVWRGRYKSALVQPDEYLLELQRYMEQLPVIEGLVDHPGQYQWSSYSQNSTGAIRTLNPHNQYLYLGGTLRERCEYYRTFLSSPSQFLWDISALIAAGRPAATADSLRTLEKNLRMTLSVRNKCGRPRKEEHRQF